jgi:MoaA/NifB/PqqE/SkfB family radical SAM enzyme
LLTKCCNARCLHCDIWKHSGQEADAPSLDQWKQLLRDLRRWLGPVHVVITGGEALLYPHATELLRHGSSLGLFLEWLTNGYWHDQGRIEEAARSNPWRITVSLDGVGQTHSKIRGREGFWDTVARTIATLHRLRQQERLRYAIRLKTVIMEHNLDDACNVARFAAERGLEVFYQPIEQNYDTPEDPLWFRHSSNWPKDPEKAVGVVRELLRLKQEGLPIRNTAVDLEVMISYFRDPDTHRVAVQAHAAHEKHLACSALNYLQVEPNGDVRPCCRRAAVGNIKCDPIRTIWNNRPRWWQRDCCLALDAAPANTP